jgi:hypothetical protein
MFNIQCSILNFQYALLGSLIFLFAGCKREVDNSLIEANSFIKVFSEAGDQHFQYIKQCDDGGFIILGIGNDSLFILKINEGGLLQWKKDVPGIDIYDMIATELKNGDILVSSIGTVGRYCRIDKNGNILSVAKYWENNNMTRFYANSYPIQMQNGQTLIAYTSGAVGGDTGRTYIARFDNNGVQNGLKPIYTTSFLNPGDITFKPLYLSLHKCDVEGEYYFNGYAFLNWNGNWRQNWRMFLAKQTYDSAGKLTSNKTVWVDPVIPDYDNVNYFQLPTDDGVLLVCTRGNKNFINNGVVIKADNELKIQWQTPLNMTPYGTYLTNATLCPDGNYLITGECIVAEKTSNQPFACKIDKSGNIIWSKIYPTNFIGSFGLGLELLDGSLIFGGYTTGFGQGADKDDIFVIKTDKDGNLK